MKKEPDLRLDSDEDDDNIVLRNMVKVTFPNKIATTLFLDDGSTCSVITHKLAGFLGLKGYPAIQYVEVAGKEFEEIRTKVYLVIVIDREGQKHAMRMIGLDRITSHPGRVDVSVAYNLFPHIEKGALDRPTQEVGLLIGQDHVNLLPTGGEGSDLVGKLRVRKVKFGSGVVLGGRHESFKGESVQLTEEARRITSLKFAKRNINGKSINLLDSRRLPTFHEAEELGTVVPRRCDRCMGCTRCSNQSQEMSRKEQEELTMLRKALVHDEENNVMTVKYPVVGDLEKMKDNRYQVVSMAKGLERKLVKKKQLEDYNKVFKEYVDRKVLVPVSAQEIKDWQESGGKIHYISHHGVVNDNSASTPLRLVANSAVKNCSTGPSANDMWPKGPNSINNLLKVFCRWRTYETAVVFDLSKAYQSVQTTEREKFLRLVVWRYGETNEDFITFGFDKMTFGDVPASVLLELVKSFAAEKFEDIDPTTAKKSVSYTHLTLPTKRIV